VPPVEGLNQACGVAVDSEGDLYAASAGSGQVKIFDPEYHELAAIANADEPCGLAVDTEGELYVSEKGTGDVVRYHPTAYPFVGTPSYGAPTTADSSGKSKGIAVDPVDDRLYVAEETRVAVYRADGSFESFLGEGELTEAFGVAAYTYVYSKNIFEELGVRQLYVADAADDTVSIFNGGVVGEPNLRTDAIAAPKLRRTLEGPRKGEEFGFGAAGAYLAVDYGNGSADGKCIQVGGVQACTAGHLFVYDDAHAVIDELDAAGEFVDQVVASPGLVDAEPTAIAVDRSGGPNDGRLYVSTGTGAGAKVLAFEPLVMPGRKPLGQPPQPGPPSQVVPNARAATADSHGFVYVAAGKEVRIYDPLGAEVTKFTDLESPLDLALDSAGRVYVIDAGPGIQTEVITYYTPSEYPSTPSTAYTRHEPPLATLSTFAKENGGTFVDIAVNPANDHLLFTNGAHTVELDSAAPGHESAVLNPKFGGGLNLGITKLALDVCGASGDVYFSKSAGSQIIVANAAGTEVLAQFTGAGAPGGLLSHQPRIAVDQSNCHVLTFAPADKAAREYDARGGFVAEFGQFGNASYDIAADSACAIHRDGAGQLAPLDEATVPSCAEYDPGNGRAYVLDGDNDLSTLDLWAFDRLSYGGPPSAFIDTAGGLGSGEATLNGSVNPEGAEVEECRFEYLTEAAYQQNLGETKPGFEGAGSEACVETPAEIGSGEEPVSVHADVVGLDPEGRYRCRVVAKNKYGEAASPVCLFGPPVIEPRSPVSLYDEAVLRARVEPAGLATAYRFEYGEAGGSVGEYAHSTPIAQLPSGESLVPVQAAIFGLEEGAEYHFRIVAENEANQVAGPDQSFSTLVRRGGGGCPNAAYRTGLAANLPDCRAYELVTPARSAGLSPVDNEGGAAFDNALTVPRGIAAGERLSFFTKGTLEGFQGNGLRDGYRADRGPGVHPAAGWTTQPAGPTFTQASGATPVTLGVAADQLYSAWAISEHDETFPETLPAGANLRTAGEAGASPCNLQSLQNDFEVVGCGDLDTDTDARLHRVATGGTHVIFSSEAHLEQDAAPEGTNAIYDRPAGSSGAKVISLGPGNVPFGSGESATYVASSEDSSGIVFRVGTTLYERRDNAETLEVTSGTPTFAGISTDGGRVAYVEGGGLFVFDADAEPPTATEVNGGVGKPITPVNVSPDGERLFFSSEAVLTGAEENENGETAEPAQRNLYVWDGAAVGFVGILDERDFEEFGALTDVGLQRWIQAASEEGAGKRAQSPTRSTVAGALVFQSHARLTAYDNEGLGEVYRYDPAALPGGRLLCLSCDPSGFPPSGEATLQDLRSKRPASRRSTLIANVTGGGDEVFFQSPDRLLPEDANEAQDVYEWRALGAGQPECTRPAGCLALITSGQGEGDNYLFAMSNDGHDVFFWTEEKLVGADAVGTKSIYDARVEGGIPDPVASEPCQGDACQGSGAEFPALPSPSTTGPGTEETGTRPCAKGKRRMKGRCVPRHRKHARRRHRKHGSGQRRGGSR
jgi:hypothetical protein